MNPQVIRRITHRCPSCNDPVAEEGKCARCKKGANRTVRVTEKDQVMLDFVCEELNINLTTALRMGLKLLYDKTATEKGGK